MYPNYHHNQQPYSFPSDMVQNQQAGTSGPQYPQMDPTWNNQMMNNGQYGNQGYANNQYWAQFGYGNNYAPPPVYNPPASAAQNIPVDQINPDAIKVTLDDSKLWNSFHKLGNEMATLPTGRIIFPYLHYTISGLQQPEKYIFGLKLRKMNGNSLEYKNKEWKETKNSINGDLESNEIFTSAQNGKIVFKNAKIHTIRKQYSRGKMEVPTNKRKRKVQVDQNEWSNNSLLVTSHCRYLPVLSIYYFDLHSAEKKFLKSFEIEETQFVVVTSYKNDAVRKLKTNQNPYARPDYKEEMDKNNSTFDSGISSMDNSIASDNSSPMAPKRATGPPVTPLIPNNLNIGSSTSNNLISSNNWQNQYQLNKENWDPSLNSGPHQVDFSTQSYPMNSGASAAGSSSSMVDQNYQFNQSWAPTTPGQSNQSWSESCLNLNFGQNDNYQF